MKWYKEPPLFFARVMAITKSPVSRLSIPLLDLWSVAVRKSWISVDKSKVDHYLRSVDGLSAIDQEWKSSISNPHPYIAILENVTLIPGSKLVIDGEGNALSDEMDAGFRIFSLRPKRWDMELSNGPRLTFKPLPLANEVIPVGIHLMGEHEANYFHWVTEILPRIYLYIKLTRDDDTQLLVSDGLNDNLYDLLRIVCGSKRVIKRLKSDLSYRVERLVYPSDVNRIFDVYDRAPSHETTYLSVGLLRNLMQAIKLAISPSTSKGHKRIFVKRASTYRRLLSEEEVENFLVDRGFLSIDPGQLSIKEQVELFAQADIVIGPSGAAMTNILWCHNQAKVLVLHSDHPFKKYPYWDALARVSGAKISYLSGPRAQNVKGVFEAHDDYYIHIDSIKYAMRGLDCA